MKPGTRVLVTGGVCRGDVGTVKGPTKYTFGDEQVYAVQLDDTGYVSSIRESLLAPEPERSETDVLASLRDNVSGRT